MKPGPSTSRARLRVESLEERCVLSTASYVNALYTDLLHRSPTTTDTSGWVAQLNAGASPLQVATAITNSTEFRLNLIQSDYQLFLQRSASGTEVQGWLGQLQNGLSEQQMAVGFLSSAEFLQLHGGSNAGWLAGVYQDALGRAPSSTDSSFWLGQLQGGQSRFSVAQQIVTSAESLNREVTSIYDQVFSRAPDVGGMTYWGGKLSQGLNSAQLEAQLAASAEFLDMQGGLGNGTITTPTPSPMPSPNPGPIHQPVSGPITPQVPGEQPPNGPLVE